MFDIGFLELVIVAVLALLVLGPERLPKAAHTMGRWIGRARRVVNNFSQEIDRQVEIEELREQLKKQGQSLDIEEDAKNIHKTVSEALAETTSVLTEPDAGELRTNTEEKPGKSTTAYEKQRDAGAQS